MLRESEAADEAPFKRKAALDADNVSGRCTYVYDDNSARIKCVHENERLDLPRNVAFLILLSTLLDYDGRNYSASTVMLKLTLRCN